MKKSKTKQKSQGKEKDLGHVRHIFFGDTPDPDFATAWPSAKKSDKKIFYNSIKSVRFEIPSTGSSGSNRPYMNFMDGTLERLTGIEKLVLAGSGMQHMTSFTSTSSSPNWNKAVIMLDPRSMAAPSFLGETSQTLDTIVYAFRHWNVLHVYAQFLQLHLAHHATCDGALKRILVVNAETTRGGTDFQKRVEVEIARTKTEDPDRADVLEPDGTFIPHTYPTLQFLTMREYLRDCDWAGEFTDEEVRPWLEEEEAERIAGIEKEKEKEEEKGEASQD
jgi:hypothetical protein